MKKGFMKLLALVLVLTSLMSPMTAYAEMSDAERAAAAKKTTASSGDKTTTGKKTTAKEANTSAVYKHGSIKASIKKYAGVNEDVKGYLVVPGTNISTPILFSAVDNDYYAYRDINGKTYANINANAPPVTATYLDFRTRFGSGWANSSRNTVIYGHNWTNCYQPFAVGNSEANKKHTMFAQLPSYNNINFAKANPHIYFSTDQNEGVWRVFSVAYAELEWEYNKPNPKDADFKNTISEMQKRSIFNFDVDVKPTDRILTLSTCTRLYAAGANQRFIVVARLLRPGESETDKVSVVANPKPKQPKW